MWGLIISEVVTIFIVTLSISRLLARSISKHFCRTFDFAATLTSWASLMVHQCLPYGEGTAMEEIAGIHRLWYRRGIILILLTFNFRCHHQWIFKSIVPNARQWAETYTQWFPVLTWFSPTFRRAPQESIDIIDSLNYPALLLKYIQNSSQVADLKGTKTYIYNGFLLSTNQSICTKITQYLWTLWRAYYHLFYHFERWALSTKSSSSISKRDRLSNVDDKLLSKFWLHLL